MTFRSVAAGLLMWAATTVAAQDAYLTNGFMPRFVKAAVDYPISVRVRNLAATPLITFRVDWRWNNGPVQQGSFQSTTGISGNQYWPYTHPIPFNSATTSAGVLKVWVVGSGETNTANDTLTFPFTVIDAWVSKTMLLDQWTATWCPNCPPANALGNLVEPDPAIVVAKHHATDEFSNASSTGYYAQYNVNFTPAGVIDNGEYGSYAPNAMHTSWAAELELRKQGVSPASVAVATDYDAESRLLTVDLETTFSYALTGEHTVNAYIVEDEIPGAQNNAPAGYIHHQLVRHVFGGADGTAGIVPATPTVGTAYATTWSLILPENWNPEHIRVIGMVTHHQGAGAYTLNTTSSEPLEVGIAEATWGARMQVYPNPADVVLWLDLPADTEAAWVRLIAVDGREVLTQRTVFNGTPVVVQGFDQLPAGTYLLRVQRGAAEAGRPIIKQ